VDKAPEIYYSEFNRWASPLNDNISRVLIGNLGMLLSTCRIVPYPWIRNIPAEYWVVVGVDRFDGVPGGKAVLDADWLVYASEREDLKAIRSVYLEQPVAEKTYDALVNAQGELLAELSRRIAEDVQTIAEKKGQER